ncbi:hypothetical protein Rsub_07974 [Raphidocelis subcapitata]|uniref:SOUL heme-binding protein n=1 Tax=Raphidocelis subcapitata TaxID=307507 RepID=A0A2V0P799_9CHLO|nr:hypothetical protein Rsub_07974 [Raphidocelis subcapitata]|eukprot:GBF94802.1 hypothetical protein Rsub_07974 [Raphidocelis subcapitata]
MLPMHRHLRAAAPTRRRAAPSAAAAAPAPAPRRPPRRAAPPRRPAPAAAAAGPSAAPKAGALDMASKLEWLKGDLSHLFDDVGVDPDGYDTKVTFLDPITKYDSVQGYLFNIKFLRLAFTPRFTLHDARVTGPEEITTKWTMSMRFAPARALGLSKWWDPEITFTGASIYGFNPANGRINRHIDTWDSITNQTYFSIEAFKDFLGQLGQLYTVPSNLETPAFELLRRGRGYEVRRYDPFLVAETPLDGCAPAAGAGSGQGEASSGGGGGGGGGADPAGPGGRAFNSLAGYLFGGNAEGRKMRMTTPVLSSSAGRMAFVIGPSDARDLSAAPAPASGAPVALRLEPGGAVAARAFGGAADPARCAAEERALRGALLRDGLRPAEGWSLARFNDPSTPGPLRRNEVLIALEPGSFDLVDE